VRSIRVPFAAILLAASWTLAPPARAITLPPDFVAEDAAPGAGFLGPTAIAFMPDGRLLVGEKNGVIYVVQNGARLEELFWNGTAEVNIAGNAGLTGIAVDPRYPVNHFVYFAYVMDPDSDNVDTGSPAFGRVVRFQTSALDSNVVDLGTKTVLIGRAWADGVPTGHVDHVIDGLRWGADGSLLLSTGDGATADSADAGGHDPELFTPGRTNPAEDIGAYRAQYINSLAGKILRINPMSGEGYATNPFAELNLQANASKVWEYGLRNPWRFCVRPGTGSANPLDGDPGTLFIGDVGWRYWEELDIAHSGRLNFGWPCYEGPVVEPDYSLRQPSHDGWGSWGGNNNPAYPTAPNLTYHHSEIDLGNPPGYAGYCLIGGIFYTGSLYPPQYRNRYFYADYGNGWIRAAGFDDSDRIVDLQLFASDAEGPVDFAADPVTGDLFYIGVNTRHVYHLRYTGPVAGNLPPLAHAAGTPLTGVAPLNVSFSSAGTVDPELDVLQLGWNFGDGKGSGLPDPVHRYDQPGVYQAVLTADDRHGGVARDTVRIVVLESGRFPGTALLDDFDRADGALGGIWTGDLLGLKIQGASLVLDSFSGYGFWFGPRFGPDQEAYLSFTGNLNPSLAGGLILKAQTDQTTEGALLVLYDATLDSVSVEASTPGEGWRAWSDKIPMHIEEGDRLGARAYANGVLEIFKNESLVATRSIADWPLAGADGYVGLALVGDPGTRVDDFGGGDIVISGNHPPSARLLTPLDGSFYASGDTIWLAGTASDDRDPEADLSYRWDVSLAHNTHIHPEIFVASGRTAHFIGENHDDGFGTHYIVHLNVTDRGGLSDLRHAEVFPEVDLEPRSPATDSEGGPGAQAPSAVTFEIANHGRMPAPRSRWALTDGLTTVAAGDTLVGSLDSVLVRVPLPASLESGDHTLRVKVDTLGQATETREDNNAIVFVITIVNGGLAVADEPRALWLGPPSPNPGRGPVTFALGLPATARVRFTIRDLQGRRVWEAPLESRTGGRLSLAWNGVTAQGVPAPAGLYFACVEVEGKRLTRRFALLR
jgi:glucose/arabinose dehydrogenase/PKD repeat protein